MFFSNYKSARRWLNSCLLLPPIGLMLYGLLANQDWAVTLGIPFIIYNYVNAFIANSTVTHLYSEIFNVDSHTKSMMEDTEDYYQAGPEYNYKHTYPGWGRDKIWLHVMVTQEEMVLLKEMEISGANRHYLIGNLITQAYNREQS